MLITITDLDMAYDDATAEHACVRIGATYNVTATIDRLPTSGTAGGWPAVTLTGTVANVVAVLVDAWGMGDDLDTLRAYLDAATYADDSPVTDDASDDASDDDDDASDDASDDDDDASDDRCRLCGIH